MSIIDDLTTAAKTPGLPAVDKAQLLWASREYAEIDGITFDLGVAWIDTRGCRWRWTGQRDSQGQALMLSALGKKASLDAVYLSHGPLWGEPRKLTGRDYRTAFAGGA
ncbi:phiSA1p31-related protein [Streptomyces sp. NPDC001404]|uniref:phiSA1p31-related protein n=1 Tax=Streptomyces sp. NPDC001404 TaxID=3364571 RepID=UPI00369B7D91